MAIWYNLLSDTKQYTWWLLSLNMKASLVFSVILNNNKQSQMTHHYLSKIICFLNSKFFSHLAAPFTGLQNLLLKYTRDEYLLRY